MMYNQLKRFCTGGGESRAPANTKSNSNQTVIKNDEKTTIRSELQTNFEKGN